MWVSPSPHPACPAASHGRGPSPGSSGAGPHHLLRQWPPLKFVEDRRGALHRFHLVRLLGLFLGDGGGVEPGLNLEGLHRRRVEGSAFLALFLVAWQWGPLPRWGRQKLLVQLHGAVPDHRPDRGGDEVREAGLVRVLAGHRVGGQLADVHRGTELEVAGPVRVRACGTCGPGRRPDRIALVIHRQLPMRARHLQGGRVGRRVNGLRLLAAPHALRGALLHPGHGAAGADPGCGLLAQGAVLQAPVPQASALANLLSRGAEMLVLHLGDVHNALQAPLLELGALKASQEPLDVLGLQSAEPSGRLVIADLVEALRELEGLGEHAPPRRGGCGVLILLRGPSPSAPGASATWRLPGHPQAGCSRGEPGHRQLLLVLRQELLHGHVLLRRVQELQERPWGRVRAFGTCATPGAASSIGSSSALRLAGIRGACSSSSALEKNRSSGA